MFSLMNSLNNQSLPFPHIDIMPSALWISTSLPVLLEGSLIGRVNHPTADPEILSAVNLDFRIASSILTCSILLH